MSRMQIYLADAFTKICPDGATIGGALQPIGDGVRLCGAGGEVVSFQLVLAAGDVCLDEVTVECEPLRGEGGEIGGIEAWRIGFLRAPSEPSTGWRSARWVSDPLFPMESFRVVHRDVQPVWVNMRIPRGVSGDFRGVCRVRARGQEPVEIPIAMRVWGFDLPAAPTLTNLFDFAIGEFSGGFQQVYGPVDGAGFPAFARFMRYLRDHGINGLFYNHPLVSSGLLTFNEADGHFRADLRRIGPVLDLLRELGMVFNHWPAPVWPTHEIFFDIYTAFAPFKDLGADVYADPRFTRALLEVGEALARAVDHEGFAYLYDEPHLPWHGDQLAALSRDFRARCPRSRQMSAIGDPAMIARVLDEDLPVDIIVGHLSFYQPDLHRRIVASGREFWWYTSNWSSSHLSFWLDEPMLHHRLLYWLTWRYGVPALGYWNTSVWNYREYGYENIDAGRRMEWPYGNWNVTPTEAWGHGNADGQLVFPGPDGPIGTLRCEAIRHGVQDHAYLTLLSAVARHDDACRELEKDIRRGIGTLKRPTRQAETLAGLRERMGTALEQAQYTS